jgi:hypothetical protein
MFLDDLRNKKQEHEDIKKILEKDYGYTVKTPVYGNSAKKALRQIKDAKQELYRDFTTEEYNRVVLFEKYLEQLNEDAGATSLAVDIAVQRQLEKTVSTEVNKKTAKLLVGNFLKGVATRHAVGSASSLATGPLAPVSAIIINAGLFGWDAVKLIKLIKNVKAANDAVYATNRAKKIGAAVVATTAVGSSVGGPGLSIYNELNKEDKLKVDAYNKTVEGIMNDAATQAETEDLYQTVLGYQGNVRDLQKKTDRLMVVRKLETRYLERGNESRAAKYTAEIKQLEEELGITAGLEAIQTTAKAEPTTAPTTAEENVVLPNSYELMMLEIQRQADILDRENAEKAARELAEKRIKEIAEWNAQQNARNALVAAGMAEEMANRKAQEIAAIENQAQQQKIINDAIAEFKADTKRSADPIDTKTYISPNDIVTQRSDNLLIQTAQSLRAQQARDALINDGMREEQKVRDAMEAAAKQAEIDLQNKRQAEQARLEQQALVNKAMQDYKRDIGKIEINIEEYEMPAHAFEPAPVKTPVKTPKTDPKIKPAKPDHHPETLPDTKPEGWPDHIVPWQDPNPDRHPPLPKTKPKPKPVKTPDYHPDDKPHELPIDKPEGWPDHIVPWQDPNPDRHPPLPKTKPGPSTRPKRRLDPDGDPVIIPKKPRPLTKPPVEVPDIKPQEPPGAPMFPEIKPTEIPKTVPATVPDVDPDMSKYVRPVPLEPHPGMDKDWELDIPEPKVQPLAPPGGVPPKEPPKIDVPYPPPDRHPPWKAPDEVVPSHKETEEERIEREKREKEKREKEKREKERTDKPVIKPVNPTDVPDQLVIIPPELGTATGTATAVGTRLAPKTGTKSGSKGRSAKPFGLPGLPGLPSWAGGQRDRPEPPLQTYLSLGPRLKRDSGWVGGVINSSIIRRGNVMNEEATFKNLKKLLEQDLDQAELALAAKDMVVQLQDIAEDLAKMQVENLMPLVDRIKEEYGPEAGEQFNGSVEAALGSALEGIKGTHEQVQDAVLVLTGEKSAMSTDMGTDDMSMDMGDTDMDDGLGDELSLDGEDAAAGPEDVSLGRAVKKENVERAKRALKTALKEGKYNDKVLRKIIQSMK